ncbi:hypothetical protein DH2020_000453 [Rehmannia glutinosa]|uniref:Uncharacterized protein n=1 Tax=Rehmannia glutinosa TaxID=99300 RepID=A0ABR0XX51_REHGL
MLATSAEDNGVCGSNPTSDDLLEYYQPISTVDNGGGDDDDEEGDCSDQNPSHNFYQLPNGWAENGVSSLDLSDDDHEDEEEDELAMESESAIE